MPDILHRISIDAQQEHVHDLIATTEGVARWWTGRPLSGESSVGSRFSVYFGDAGQPAAVMEVTSDKLDEVAWRVVEGVPRRRDQPLAMTRERRESRIRATGCPSAPVPFVY